MGWLEDAGETDPEFPTIEPAIRHARTLQRPNVPAAVWTSQRDASDLVCLVYDGQVFVHRLRSTSFYRLAFLALTVLGLAVMRWTTSVAMDASRPVIRRVGMLVVTIALAALLVPIAGAAFSRRVPYWAKRLFKS